MATDTVINRPAPFVEDIGKNLAEQTVAQTQVPVVTTGLAGLGTMAQPTQQAFETADQFKLRQDLFGAQQSELEFIYRSAFEKFEISKSKMKRYAHRRNRETEVEQLSNLTLANN